MINTDLVTSIYNLKSFLFQINSPLLTIYFGDKEFLEPSQLGIVMVNIVAAIQLWQVPMGKTRQDFVDMLKR